MPDVEVGEQTPLLSAEGGGSGAANAHQPEAVVLQEMKAESLKERAVAATAAVSCKFALHLLVIARMACRKRTFGP